MPDSLGTNQRLKSGLEFREIYAERVFVRNQELSLCYRPARLGHSRLGLSVSRRIGNAVARNRVKRVLRECYRRLAKTIKQPVDLIIIPRNFQSASDYEVMLRSLDKLIAKLNGRLS